MAETAKAGAAPGTPRSNIASRIRSEIALWPQPAQSVVFPPR